MPFKKIIPSLKETLSQAGIENPTPFQQKIIPKIKSGVSLFGIGPLGCGKTTSLIISTLQKLNYEALEDAPRALIIVKDKQAAETLEEQFKAFTRQSDIRIFCAHDDHSIDKQIGNIYVGVDIVITTAKRLSKIYFLNGINLSQLQLFIIDDAEQLSINDYSRDLNRISESISKCQYVIFAEKFDPKLERLQHTFMETALLIKVKEKE